MQPAIRFSPSALVSMEQSINNYLLFLKETENKRSLTSHKYSFYITTVQKFPETD